MQNEEWIKNGNQEKIAELQRAPTTQQHCSWRTPPRKIYDANGGRFWLTIFTCLQWNYTSQSFSLATALQQVSKLKNCELKQEPYTLATKPYQPLKFHNRERMSFFTFAELGWNCSEMVVSGLIFVLTLNRASALTVSDNEWNFLLPPHFVATTEGSV
mgnify:CR=1 FL=1